MKIRLFLLLGVILLIACSPNFRKETATTLSISINADQKEILTLSDYFSEISYIPLSDSFLIGTIERAKVYDDKLLVLTGKSLLMFDTHSGDALLFLRRLGNAPGEYLSIYDMFYDGSANAIELLDMNSKKVLVYGLDGHFINEFKISFYSFAFHKLQPSVYLFYNNNVVSDFTDHKLIQYNTMEGKIEAQWLPIDKHLAKYFFMVDANNFGSANMLSFHYCASDIVYGIADNNAPYPKYRIDFGKHQLPISFLKEDYVDIRDFSEKAVRRSYIYAYGDFVENEHVAALSFRNDDETCWVLYDKNMQTAKTFDKWIDNFHSHTPVKITYDNGPYIMDNNYFYFFIQPDQLLDLIDKENKMDNQQGVQKVFEDIYNTVGFSEQSNPLLVKCKIKL